MIAICISNHVLKIFIDFIYSNLFVRDKYETRLMKVFCLVSFLIYFTLPFLLSLVYFCNLMQHLISAVARCNN